MKSACIEEHGTIGRSRNRIVRKTVNTEHAEDSEPNDYLDIPSDLGQWVDKPTLLRWLVEDIDTLDWGNAELVEFLRQHPDYQPKMLLQLLAYAYATGTFESGQVELVYHQDKVFCDLGWQKPPTVRSIRLFRRENRGLFKWALYQVLQRLIRTRFGLGDRLMPAGLKRYLIDNAIERIDLARCLDHAEREN